MELVIEGLMFGSCELMSGHKIIEERLNGFTDG